MKFVRAIKIFLNLLCWIFIGCMVVVMGSSLFSHITGEPPSLFGYSIYRVSTGSMEPAIEIGDVILEKTADSSTQYNVGDIITFKGVGELSGKLVTHRIIRAPFKDGNKVKVQTCGDANDLYDTPVPVKNIKGVYINTIPVLTKIYNILLSSWGIMIIIGLLIFIFVDEIIRIFKTLFFTSKEPSPQQNAQIEDIIESVKTSDVNNSGD